MAELFINPLFSDANLVSYWRMEGNSNDSKGSNNGTDTNITYNASYGKFGQGALFNGTDSRIAIANASSLKPANFTIIARIYPTESNRLGSIYSSYRNTEAGYAFQLNSDNKLRVYFNSSYVVASSSITTPINKWTFVVATFNGTNCKIYQNTVEVGSGNVTFDNTNINEFRIGDIINGTTETQFWKGYLDDIAVYSRVLTSAEILSLYKDFKIKTNWFM